MVYPHTSREASYSCSCISDPLVGLCVQGQVFGDGGADVRKVMSGVESVVLDCNDWRCLRVLYLDARLLQADGQARSLCKPKKNDWSSCWVWLATAASSANNMSLTRASRTLNIRRTSTSGSLGAGPRAVRWEIICTCDWQIVLWTRHAVVSLNRLSLGCETSARRQSGATYALLM